MTRRKKNLHALAVVPDEAAPLATRESLERDAVRFAEGSLAPESLALYARQWREFLSWCKDHGLPPYPEKDGPAITAALYVTALGKQGVAVSTIGQRLAAIGLFYGRDGIQPPRKSIQVTSVLKGVRRALGVDQDGAEPLLANDVRKILALLAGREDIQAARDRALLALGFSMAARRSELVGLDVEDLAFGENGVTVRVGGRRSTGEVKRTKTNQEGKAEFAPVAFGSPKSCPVRLTKAWLARAKITKGPVFRRVWAGSEKTGGRLCGRGVSNAVKRYVELIGLDPLDYSAHSLRAGFVTSADMDGIPERVIMGVTRHRTAAMMRRYVRDRDMWRDLKALL